MDEGRDTPQSGGSVLHQAVALCPLHRVAVGLRSLLVAPPVTGTDVQVMRLAARGLIAKQIGVELGLSERQVERHLFDARHELGAKNTVEAVSKFLLSEWKSKRGRKIPPMKQPSAPQQFLLDGQELA